MARRGLIISEEQEGWSFKMFMVKHMARRGLVISEEQKG